MPHSGGGGSHSGGSHSGGHSSSYSNSSDRSYDRERTTRYYYSNRNWSLINDNIVLKIAVIFLIIILLILGLFPLKMAIHFPEKLETSNEIVIHDDLGIVNNSILDPALKEYQDATGITPAIVTGVNDDWANYSSMENYAYDLYVNMFNNDETYLLIVYTTDLDDTSFDNWNYELMLGDDTSAVLSNYETKKLNNNLHDGFVNTNTTFSEDIADALKASAKTSMEISIEPSAMLLSSMWYGFIILSTIKFLRS